MADTYRRKMTAYEEVNWQYNKAADLLGMHRNTLSRKMSEYRLRRSA